MTLDCGVRLLRVGFWLTSTVAVTAWSEQYLSCCSRSGHLSVAELERLLTAMNGNKPAGN